MSRRDHGDDNNKTNAASRRQYAAGSRSDQTRDRPASCSLASNILRPDRLDDSQKAKLSVKNVQRVEIITANTNAAAHGANEATRF